MMVYVQRDGFLWLITSVIFQSIGLRNWEWRVDLMKSRWRKEKDTRRWSQRCSQMMREKWVRFLIYTQIHNQIIRFTIHLIGYEQAPHLFIWRKFICRLSRLNTMDMRTEYMVVTFYIMSLLRMLRTSSCPRRLGQVRSTGRHWDTRDRKNNHKQLRRNSRINT